MNQPSSYHWELMEEINPDQRKKWNEFCSLVNVNDSIPAKYKELIVCGMAYVLHCKPATITHTMNAMEKYGATKEEVFTTLGLAMMMGGATAYRDACLNLEEYLKTK